MLGLFCSFDIGTEAFRAHYYEPNQQRLRQPQIKKRKKEKNLPIFGRNSVAVFVFFHSKVSKPRLAAILR
jgi:hypothetical protein